MERLHFICSLSFFNIVLTIFNYLIIPTTFTGWPILNHMENPLQKALTTGILYLIFSSAALLNAQTDQGSLETGFKNPPESARPRTWWHWTNSNVTKEGITKDLEWMKRAGIGGMQLADVASGQGQTVDRKIVFGTPEWLDAVKHAASEADRLGLEMSIFSSPGWSLTGGPWVKPDQAMKKLVWSEMSIKGPQNFAGSLPSPASNEGPIRNMSRSARISPDEILFYKDCIVLAYPTPEVEPDEITVPVVTTSAGPVNPDALLDDDLNTSAVIKAGKDRKTTWIQYSYDKPFTAQALTLGSRNGIPVGTLKISDNGTDFRIIALFPGAQLYRAGKVETISFPPASSRFYRIEFSGSPMKPADVMAENTTPPDSSYNFSELKLHTGARINRWEDKAGFFHLFSYESVGTPGVSASSSIDTSAIVCLNPNVSTDGTLRWKVPAGRWTIIRFGYSLTGSRNRPAVPAGSGYEVDKLSRENTKAYIKAYTDPIAGALGDLYGKSLQYVLLDSWEAGMQNWTDSMVIEFTRRRGYDPIRWLPCLAGRVVGNSEMSDRFLWDFRRTLADMFAENHYGVISEYLHNQGIKTYGEASGVSLEILEDALLCKKYTDIPMGEFWYRALHPELMYYQDVRGAASASHVYGKQVTAAESFTGGGFESPYTLKKIGDYWFTQGINRFVFHTSAHQPLDTKPGNIMVGTHINRNITWAEQALPFMTYLSRISYMLQQGKFMASLVYLLDEGAPSTMPIWGTGLNPSPPEGYDYDYTNADALLTRFSVDNDGRLILPDGMTYDILVLPNTIRMTLPVLQKIGDLIRAGATVIGSKPLQTPGLKDYPWSEDQFKVITNEIWGDLDGISRTRRTFGKGKIIWGTPADKALLMNGIGPDLEYERPLDTRINWIHRRDGESDIYFLVNSSDKPIETTIRFNVSGREVELWDPLSGQIRQSGYTMTGKSTIVPLRLTERQSVFVVFRNKTAVDSRNIFQPSPSTIDTLTGSWEITFPPALGAPDKIIAQNLVSLTIYQDEGIKYFSGTATYTKTFEAPKSWFTAGIKLLLDLGKVGDIAEVSVNGSPPVILWAGPFRTDITGMVKKGTNSIKIKVTNEWTNRLAGDQKEPPEKKILKSSLSVFPGRNLNDSGLLGPVTILKY